MPEACVLFFRIASRRLLEPQKLINPVNQRSIMLKITICRAKVGFCVLLAAMMIFGVNTIAYAQTSDHKAGPGAYAKKSQKKNVQTPKQSTKPDPAGEESQGDMMHSMMSRLIQNMMEQRTSDLFGQGATGDQRQFNTAPGMNQDSQAVQQLTQMINNNPAFRDQFMDMLNNDDRFRSTVMDSIKNTGQNGQEFAKNFTENSDYRKNFTDKFNSDSNFRNTALQSINSWYSGQEATPKQPAQPNQQNQPNQLQPNQPTPNPQPSPNQPNF
jgi:hypothetical protein